MTRLAEPRVSNDHSSDTRPASLPALASLGGFRSLLPEVHRLYFEPQYEEFSPRTMWSLSNAFTSAFKNLDPIPQFQGHGKTERIP